ncbi:MAG: glycosyltransferase family 4 protein [Proteobacteria bacterium]|nr:glycosyltransferase family 4 protein [Pseudomonadota bacterium]
MAEKNIGFVSTRFSGIDGVSLEASKWAAVFEQAGHKCCWFAGQLDRPAERSHLVPEAHFTYGQNEWINRRILGRKARKPSVTEAIHSLRFRLKEHLYEFIERFDIDLLIAENVLTIPMHIPLGLALTEIVAETEMPTIAHHHDFYWERDRFAINAAGDYLRTSFPPVLPAIEHVVINSEACEQLAHRAGISSAIIPNVLDFENPPAVDEGDARAFRESIGLEPGDRMILQPTRIVQRKGIEHAVELLAELNDPRNKLVVSHEAGDEGFEYQGWLEEIASKRGVDLRFIATGITDPWANNDVKTEYSLWDVYPYADFITYPSLYEGFGNAFLEAVYFRKPILINRYSTFIRDIEPLGFCLAVMDGFLSEKTVRQVGELLEPSLQRENMVSLNYEIAQRYFSYSVLRNQLNGILFKFFGDSAQRLFGRRLEQPAIAYPNANRPRIWQELINSLEIPKNVSSPIEPGFSMQSSMDLKDVREEMLEN